jgi:hypothetical protein
LNSLTLLQGTTANQSRNLKELQLPSSAFLGNDSVELLSLGKYQLSSELKSFENLKGFFQRDPEVPAATTQNSRDTQVPQTPSAVRPSSSSGALVESNAVKLVNSISATRGGVFTELQLLSLPLAGIRTFDALALLLPGVVGPPQTISAAVGPGIGSSVGTAGQFSVNGLRSRGNNFTIDGSDNNDEDIGVRRQGFTSLVPQSIESVKQFQISTLLPEPQFGRNMGAQANAVSRSGGAGFHGTLYGFLTDSRLNARDFFDLDGKDLPGTFPVLRSDANSAQVKMDRELLTEVNRVGSENPFTRSQAGFVFGGPLKNGKSYVFGAFEHQDINASRESHFAVPTVSQRGLFNNGAEGMFLQGQGSSNSIGVYPTSAFGDAVFSLFPWPNDPLGPYGYNTRTEILPADADGSVFSFKTDHNLNLFGKEHRFSGRYNFSDDSTTIPFTGGALFSSIRSNVRTQNLSLFVGSTGNKTSNEIRVSYGRSSLALDEFPNGLKGERAVDFTDERDRAFLLNAPLIYNLTNGRFPDTTTYRSYASLKKQGARNLPAVDGTEAVTGPIGQLMMSGFSPLGVDVFNLPQQRSNNTFQVADVIVWSVGGIHRITAGFDIRRSQLNSFLDRDSRSQMVFSGAPNLNQVNGEVVPILGPENATNDTYAGADFAAVGAPTGFFQTLSGPKGFGTIGLRYWQTDFFLSDGIRVRTNLNINAGLRYSQNTTPREVVHRIEDSFTSEEVRAFITREKEESQKIGGAPISGLELFLDGRTSIFQSDKNNFAPYFSFAWDPSGKGRTSLRGGMGLYYDQIPGAVISQSRNVFPNFLTLNLGGYRRNPEDPASKFTLGATNPSCSSEDRIQSPQLCFTIPGTINKYDTSGSGGPDIVEFMLDTARRTNFASGPAFVLPSNTLKTPYAWHWGLTLERDLSRRVLVSMAYVGTQSMHLLRFSTPNLGPNAVPTVLAIASPPDHVPLFIGTTNSPGTSVLNQDSDSPLSTNKRPFPLLGSYSSIESDANSSYNGFQLQVIKQFSGAVQMTAAYTWCHTIDEVSDLFDLAGARSLPQNSFNLRADRGSASFDVRHRLAYSFIWDLPVARQSRALGGWQVSGIGTLQTGPPFTILAPIDENLDGNLSDRLNSSSGFKEVNENELRFEYGAASTQLAAIGRDGAVGRNTFRAPGIATLDLAASKSFRFTERHKLEFRVEFFNLFNRTHFGIPVNQVGFPGFGRSVNTIVPARTIQLALRYSF